MKRTEVPPSLIRIGIDLGGTKTEGIALGAAGEERARFRVPTPRGDYDATVRTIADLVARLESATGAAGSTVGIGIPGAISPATGLVKNANSTWLIGKPFDRDLAAALKRRVRIENDANCLAVSEAADGAGAGCGVVFAAILGTGCGAGIVVDGRPLGGRNAIGGEWGHNPLPWPTDAEWPGPPCYCGKSGCLETFVSGPAVAADHRRATGTDLTAESIAALAERGDAKARATLDRLVDRLGRGLASIINVLDPDVIVLGGGLSNLDVLYAALPPVIARWTFTDSLDTPVRRAAHGDSSGVRGAAWLWRPEEAAVIARNCTPD
ncbi:ROK family protein [Azospirillum brasilense]|uniref:ROK family protein n=1 Tax=Azospirillum brasilense TaxID=192 RepID=UPI000E68F126|nr:ROK family protein [Azospirillum brasilense]NUB24217.1 ROK family protein [Azospirillum brasilense]NUB31254.1 ROK family protein [Azospirillum brasilense]RIW01615.1 ROK family protein [Azospirillum brasilense]